MTNATTLADVLRGRVSAMRKEAAAAAAVRRSQARRAALSKTATDAAYVEGFCKAAEAMGVDPGALYKQALLGAIKGPAGQRGNQQPAAPGAAV